MITQKNHSLTNPPKMVCKRMLQMNNLHTDLFSIDSALKLLLLEYVWVIWKWKRNLHTAGRNRFSIIRFKVTVHIPVAWKWICWRISWEIEAIKISYNIICNWLKQRIISFVGPIVNTWNSYMRGVKALLPLKL